MKKNWWKALSVILILYTILLGLYTPLKPALVDEHLKAIETAHVGQPLVIKATGYNTAFTKSKNINAWLTIVDSIRGKGGLPPVYPIKAEKISVLDDTHLYIAFQLPAILPLSKELQEANLVLDTDEEGLLLRKTVVQIAQDSMNAELGRTLWNADMDIEPRPKKFSFPNLE